MAKREVAFIEWIDPGGRSGWESRDGVLAHAGRVMDNPCYAAGLIVDRNDDRLVLAVGENPLSDDYIQSLTVPFACIRRIETWTPPRQKEPSR